MAVFVTVTHNDGSETSAKVTASTEVAFERHFKLSWLEAFSSTYPFKEYVFFAAWSSAQKAGKTNLDLDTFIDTIDDVALDSDAVPPTDPEALPG